MPDSPQPIESLFAFADALAHHMGWPVSAVHPPVQPVTPSMLWNAPTALREALTGTSTAQTVVLTSPAGVDLVAVPTPGQKDRVTVALLYPRDMPLSGRNALQTNAPLPVDAHSTRQGFERFRIIYGTFDRRFAQVKAAFAPDAHRASADRFADYSAELARRLPGTWTVQPLYPRNRGDRRIIERQLWSADPGDGFFLAERSLRAAQLRRGEDQLLLLQDAGPGQGLGIVPLLPRSLPVSPAQTPAPPRTGLPDSAKLAAALVTEQILPALGRARWVTTIGLLDHALVELRQAEDAWDAVSDAHGDKDGYPFDKDAFAAGTVMRDRRAFNALLVFLDHAPGVIAGIHTHASPDQVTKGLPVLTGLARQLMEGNKLLDEYIALSTGVGREAEAELEVERNGDAWHITRNLAGLGPHMLDAARQVTSHIGPTPTGRNKSTTRPSSTPGREMPPPPPAAGPPSGRGPR
jgi:hypothetical protein